MFTIKSIQRKIIKTFLNSSKFYQIKTFFNTFHFQSQILKFIFLSLSNIRSKQFFSKNHRQYQSLYGSDIQKHEVRRMEQPSLVEMDKKIVLINSIILNTFPSMKIIQFMYRMWTIIVL
jgi:hypothetical protein